MRPRPAAAAAAVHAEQPHEGGPSRVRCGDTPARARFPVSTAGCAQKKTPLGAVPVVSQQTGRLPAHRAQNREPHPLPGVSRGWGVGAARTQPRDAQVCGVPTDAGAEPDRGRGTGGARMDRIWAQQVAGPPVPEHHLCHVLGRAARGTGGRNANPVDMPSVGRRRRAVGWRAALTGSKPAPRTSTSRTGDRCRGQPRRPLAELGGVRSGVPVPDEPLTERVGEEEVPDDAPAVFVPATQADAHAGLNLVPRVRRRRQTPAAFVGAFCRVGFRGVDTLYANPGPGVADEVLPGCRVFPRGCRHAAPAAGGCGVFPAVGGRGSPRCRRSGAFAVENRPAAVHDVVDLEPAGRMVRRRPFLDGKTRAARHTPRNAPGKLRARRTPPAKRREPLCFFF
jgi:hypothetical protein